MFVKQGEEMSTSREMKADVPQGSVLGLLLYTLYTSDLPETEFVTTATFADDTAILGISEGNNVASDIVQTHLGKIQSWLEKWRIKTNIRKGVHTTFTMRKGNCPPVTLNNEIVPERDDVKYLGLYLDRRLTWKKHLTTKRDELSLKHRKLNWMIGRRSKLSLYNKLLVYKIIRIELWGTASKSNREKIQRFQNKCLRAIANAGWYHRNYEIHDYLQVNSVEDEIKRRSASYQNRLHEHQNNLALELLDNSTTTRRLKRTHVLDLN